MKSPFNEIELVNQFRVASLFQERANRVHVATKLQIHFVLVIVGTL